MQLSPQQQTVLNYLLTGDRSVFLTGNAGTGKSTIIREFKRLTEKNNGIVYLAPTGIAAVNIRGSTVHSFFRVPIGVLDIEGLKLSSKFAQMVPQVHTIVIDEISMVRADLLDAMDHLLRKASPKKKKRVPFGGKRLIMIGDLCQLPPVVTSKERDYFEYRFGSPSGWCFESPAFHTLDPRVFNLTQSFRQSGDSLFVDLLNRIRDGDSSAVHAINERANFTSKASEQQVVLTATNKQAEQYNEARMAGLQTPPRTYTGSAYGKFFPFMFPVSDQLVLKKGARVMALRNSEEFLNGSIGIVTRLDESSVSVRFDDTQLESIVTPVKWENIEYEFNGMRVTPEVKGSYTQIPLKPAWGMTIHKSQGQGFPSAFIHLGTKGAFAHGQLYVALSRIETLAGLHLHSKLNLSDVIIDPEVRKFLRGEWKPKQVPQRALWGS